MSTASPSPVDTPARPRTAVIAGGGIAGLASAIALGRAGWDVTVLERAESIGERGSGLALWPGGTAALETLALGPSVADVSHLGETGGFRACDGRLLAQVDPDRFRDRFGPTTAIARGDLLELLHHGAQWAGARIVTGARVRRAGASGAVGWETGGREESALVDLVVGADGIGSAVRRAVLPTAAGPQSTGLVAWRWVVDLDAVEEPLTGPDGEPWVPAQCSTLGRGMEFGIIPLPGGRVYCYASSAPTGDGPVPGPEAYLTWHDPIPALVRAGLAASSPMDRRELADLPALSTFAVGRVLLVGDAAHAMTPHLGQGACQALEDAAALARCAQRISDPAQLARAVDAERRPRTQRFQAGSRRAMGAMAMGSPLLCGLRDSLLAALPDALVTEAIGRNAQ